MMCGPLAAGADPNALLHKGAPAFARTDFQGRHVNLKAMRGHVVLLSFWATWCAPCQIEMAKFAEWRTEYGELGFEVIAVSMDDEDAAARAFVAKMKLGFPVTMGDAKLGKLYGGVLGLPLTFLIDREGRVAAVFKGEADLTSMESALKKLLNEPVRYSRY